MEHRVFRCGSGHFMTMYLHICKIKRYIGENPLKWIMSITHTIAWCDVKRITLLQTGIKKPL